MEEEQKSKKVEYRTINVSLNLIKILDKISIDLQDYLWNSVKLTYPEITDILAKKINEKNIKI
jgi:hypothetical protein